MRWTPGRTLLWAMLAGWLLGTPSSVLGASGDGGDGVVGRKASTASVPVQSASAGADASLQKWSRVARRAPAGVTDPVRLTAYGWIRFFQKFISPVDGASCTYSPSCSSYGLRAVEEYGLLRGAPMAAERIMRDHQPENTVRYPLHEKNGEFYYRDPVRPRENGG